MMINFKMKNILLSDRIEGTRWQLIPMIVRLGRRLNVPLKYSKSPNLPLWWRCCMKRLRNWATQSRRIHFWMGTSVHVSQSPPLPQSYLSVEPTSENVAIVPPSWCSTCRPSWRRIIIQKLHYTHSTTYIVQNFHFTNTTKKGAPKNTLKHL